MSEKYKVREHGWPYFVTFTVERWIDVYTRENYRAVFVESLNYCIQKKGVIVHAWVLMTNHAHLLINTTDGFRIEDFVRDFKRHTSKTTFKMIEQNTLESRDWMAYLFLRSGSFNTMNKDIQFWRNGYHPIHCWKNELIQQKIRYIHDNPVRAGHVEHAEDWKYSSAKHYATGQGMIEIDMLVLF